MTVLRATNGNVQLSGGGLGSLPGGAWWVSAIVRRGGTTTDGFECISALVDGGVVVTNIGADAGASPYQLLVGHGGLEASFTGLDAFADNSFYLLFAQKASGDASPRANAYNGSAWLGWVTGSAEFENRGDVPDAGWMLNMPGGFPWNGDVQIVAWGSGNLSETDVTNGTIGLHIGAQQWLDFAPTVLWRAANPVTDESGNSPAANETSRSGISMVEEEPAWFNFDLGGGATDVTPADATHTHTAEQPTITQTHVIAVNDATHSHTAESPALTQVHQISVDSATHAHTAEQPALTGTHVLAGENAVHAQTAESPTITQLHVLSANDAVHTQTADQPALIQTHSITSDDATHAQAAEQPTVTQLHILQPDDSEHEQIADEGQLLLEGAISVNSATHSHTAESPALSQVHAVAAADATHSQTAEQPTLSHIHNIVPSDATHAHTADSALITQLHQLIANSAAHVHRADSPTLNAPSVAVYIAVVILETFEGGPASGALPSTGPAEATLPVYE
jgi:hypothetical protein